MGSGELFLALLPLLLSKELGVAFILTIGLWRASAWLADQGYLRSRPYDHY